MERDLNIQELAIVVAAAIALHKLKSCANLKV